jgi:hypothetical protein
MEEKEKELIENFVDYFGVKKILKCIDIDDIMDNIDVIDILNNVDDDDLIDAMDNTSNVLAVLDNEEIVDYLKDEGYAVYDENEDPSENTIMDKVEEICREIKPNGYIDKQEAKKMICDYLDYWMFKSF